MNILVDIGHPGHVHLYRHFISEMEKRGHRVFVTVKDLAIARQLLDHFRIRYHDLGKKHDSLLGKGLSQLQYNWKVLGIVRKNNIQLGIGSSITLAHISRVSKMRSIVFDDDDDEVQPLFVKYAHPYCDHLVSPDVLTGKRKRKDTVYYPGYHELAYLHPNRFTPDESALGEAGLKPGEPFFLMRFNVFKAHHDVGIRGLNLDQKLRLIRLLEPQGRIIITTEREIEPELEPYRLRIEPAKVHSLLYYATLFLGDSQTMTSEAAVLGTPSVRCNSFAGAISYLEEEEHKYGLTWGFLPHQFDDLIKRTEQLLSDQALSLKWQEKRARLLEDKIDTTAFMVWLAERYPGSFHEIYRDKDLFRKFQLIT